MKNPLKDRLMSKAANALLIAVFLTAAAGCISDKSNRSAPSIPAEPQTSAGSQPVPDKKAEARPMTGQAERKPAHLTPETPAVAKPETSHAQRKPTHIARRSPSEPGPPASFTEKLDGYAVPTEYLFVKSRHFPGAVVSVALPLSYQEQSGRTYPLVIAFGGAGECARAPRQGSLAWVDYYKTDEAVKALASNHLVSKDFRGLATSAELSSFNRRLKSHSYRGMILVCPYSPPLAAAIGLEMPEYERFIVDDLVPQLKKRYRITPGAIGVDGVSMGGARSIYYGFKYPDIFRSIGAVQGAFGPYFPIYRDLIRENRDLLKERSIQLVTSDKDFCARSVERMHRLLVKERIPHSLLRLTGPHDYIFNQGPGALALLMFHNEALGSRPSGPVR